MQCVNGSLGKDVARMTCPVCRNFIQPGADVCDNCGYVVPAGANPTKGAPKQQAAKGGKAAVVTPPPATSASRTCPNCGNPVAANADVCDNCGMLLTGSAPSTPAMTPAQLSAANICPNCGNAVGSNDKFCRKCGFNFVTAGLRAAATAPVSGTSGNAPATTGGPRLAVGSRLGDSGKYQITKAIGAGGMGAVFLATDTVLKRPVVVKALLEANDPDLAEQAVKEREFLADIKHPNIVGIYDFITQGTEGYIVMEFVSGQTILQIMEERNQPLSPDEAIGYILDVLPAFAYLHKLNYVYCDFKPQNMMLEKLKDGKEIIKLIDLGTVIKYEPNPKAVYGTHGYYAPEAVDHPSPQTDLYTICRSLAWMVSLFDLNNPQFGMPTFDQAPIFQNYPSLYRFLQKGTHRDPARRFQNAQDMIDQLQGVRRISAGGPAGVPVASLNFSSGSLHSTGRLTTSFGTQASIDERDSAADVLRQGDTALRAGSGTAALLLYNQAVKANPRSVDGRLRVVDVLLSENKLDEARAAVADVSRIDPRNWKVAWADGRIREAQGDFAGARRIYEELTTELPGELPPILALARVSAAQNDARQAEGLYRMVAQADSGNTEAAFGLANSLAAQGKWDDAVKALNNVGASSARFVDAQLLAADMILNRKPQRSPTDLAAAANGLQQIAGLADSPRYLLLRADLLRQMWEASKANALPPDVVVPTRDGGTPQQTGRTNARQIGSLAEEAYREYLNRNPADPDRDSIARRKFEVAPWRLA